MLKNKMYYGIIIFCTLTASTIFSLPEKESMKGLSRRSRPTSGKVLALACASTGCCLGVVTKIAGYGFGPCEGAALGLTCSITLLPVVLNCMSRHQKQK